MARTIVEDKPTPSQPNVQIFVDGTPENGSQQKFEFTMNENPVKITVEDGSGKVYERDVQVTCRAKTEGKWAITSVLDWDGVMSVPRVLTRQPPSWLWGEDDEHTWAWYVARDPPPPRVLTPDELLIKAHFDQIMERASPTYIEDAYHRGSWLRRLACFALYGWENTPDHRFYDILVKEWNEYYALVSPGHQNDDAEEDDPSSDSEKGSEK